MTKTKTRIDVSDLQLVETHKDIKLPERSDVDFKGSIKINGRTLPVKLHLFRVDKEGWQIGKWNASMTINEQPLPNIRDKDYINKFPATCCDCHKESAVAKAVAKVVHPWLNAQGYEIGEGIGHRVVRKGVASVTRTLWWLFDFYCDHVGPKTYGRSRRQFYHTETREVTCPVHGTFTMTGEELSL